MNNTQEALAYARDLTNSTSVSFTDAFALPHLIEAGKKWVKAMLKKAPTYFWTWGWTNTVIGQSEYTIDTFTFPDTTTRDITSVDRVSVKYSATGKYYQLEKRDFHSLEDDIENYSDYSGTPFYFIRDKSVFVFPAPTGVVTGWVKIYGNYRPLDLVISTDNTQIKTPKLNIIYLSYYLASMYWTANLREDKAVENMTKCEAEIQAMCETIKMQDNEPIKQRVSTNKFPN